MGIFVLLGLMILAILGPTKEEQEYKAQREYEEWRAYQAMLDIKCTAKWCTNQKMFDSMMKLKHGDEWPKYSHYFEEFHGKDD